MNAYEHLGFLLSALFDAVHYVFLLNTINAVFETRSEEGTRSCFLFFKDVKGT